MMLRVLQNKPVFIGFFLKKLKLPKNKKTAVTILQLTYNSINFHKINL